MKDTLPEKDDLGPTQTPDDVQKDSKVNITRFFLSLIQAFLRTGYYTPDHPESEKARLGLHNDFKNIFSQKNEVTFLVHDDTEETRVLIEGALPEPQDLKDLMLQGMAEMYTPKFTKFLERKDLVSLTLKNTMTEEEFTNFVDVMGEPNFVDTREKTDKERFIQTLKDKGISNISYIFKEDLLATKRNIPWRSQVALSRLKKDFKMLPLYDDMDKEGLKEVRRQIIHEVARPLLEAKVIYPILLNTDLAETEEFKESDIDEEIIASLSDELLLSISKRLLKEALPFGETGPLKRKALKLAEQVVSSLNQREGIEKDAILVEFFKRKLISADELPDTSQRKAKIEQLTDKFLEQTDSFFDQFNKIEDGEKYINVAQSLTKMIPELVRRDRYEEILKLITYIDHHSNQEKPLAASAQQILEEIKKSEIPGALKGKFLTGQREICQAIAPIFLKLHKASIPHLLSILKESNDQLVLKGACEILIEIDSSAIKFILDELNKEEIPTEFAIDIIRVLGEIKHEEWIKPLAKTLLTYTKHENPHLREEALWVYYKIVGGGGEKLYLNHLNDPDSAVQKRAIQCLGRVKSEVALKQFLGMLQKNEDGQPDKNRHLETSIFNSFGFYGNKEWPGIGTLEDYLLETIDRHHNLGPLKFFKKIKNPLSDAAINTICETLGKIGTDKSRATLLKLGKQQDSLWKNNAEEALRKIAERTVGERPTQAPGR
jgi:HEAT repeat protein